MEPCNKRFRVRQAIEPDSQAKFTKKQPEIAGKGHENDKKQRFLLATSASQFIYHIGKKGRPRFF